MNLEYKTKYLKYKKKYLKLKEIFGGAGLTEEEIKKKNDKIRSKFAMAREAMQNNQGPYDYSGQSQVAAYNKPSANTNNSGSTRGRSLTEMAGLVAAGTLADKKPLASADLIKTKGDLIFGLLKQNIKKTDKIIIIDFENIKREIVKMFSGEEVFIEDYKKKHNNAYLNYRKIGKFIVSERQHILAWLYIIKFYANNPDSEKNFDKIIIICKESTWQEWFDYAFTQFPGKEEELKSKFLIVNVKITAKEQLLKDRAPLLEKAHRGIDDFFMFIIKLYLQSYNINNIQILTYDLSCNRDFKNFQILLSDYKLATDADLKTTIIISHKKLGFKAWEAYKKTKTNTDPLVQIIETAYTDTNKSLLYDIQALENIDILQCGKEILETQKKYFENYKNSKVPDITNFHYDRVVSTVEDLTTAGYLKPEKLEEYKQKIIKPNQEIKRKDYDVVNLDNYDTGEVPKYKKRFINSKISAVGETASVTITKPPEGGRTLADLRAAPSPPRLKKETPPLKKKIPPLERPKSSEVRKLFETEETSTELTPEERREERRKEKKKNKRQKQKQKKREKKAAAAE